MDLLHFVTGRSAVGGSGSSGLPTVDTEILAGEAVAEGDAIVQILSGPNKGQGFFAADPFLPGGKARPFTATTDLVNGYLTDPLVAGALGAGQPSGVLGTRLAVLTNKNIALVWAVAGSVYVATYSPVGVQLSGPTLAISAPSGQASRLAVTAAAGGGFAVAFGSITVNGQAPRIALFDANGASVGGITALETSGGANAIALTNLANGNVAVAYVSSALQLKLAIFNAVGQQVGSTQSLMSDVKVWQSGNTDFSTYSVKLVSLTGNNFVLALIAGSGTSENSIYTAVFNQTGGTVKALAPLTIGVATATASRSWFDIVALTDGGFGVAASGNSVGSQDGTEVLSAARYSPAGALVGATQQLRSKNPSGTGGSTSGILGQSVAALSDGAFLVLNVGLSATLEAAVIAANGDLSSGLTTTGYTGFTGGVTDNAKAKTLQDGTLAVTGLASGNAVVLRLSQVAGVWTASPPKSLVDVLPAGQGTPTGLSRDLVTLTDTGSNSGLTYAVATLGVTATAGRTALHLVNGLVAARRWAGVALAGTPIGSAIPTRIMGQAKTRITFSAPVGIDQTTTDGTGATPPGQKGFIVGNKAVLRGVQA